MDAPVIDEFPGAGIGIIPPVGEVRSFSAFFPPPYRVLVLVSLGMILFGSNFRLLARRGIDLWSLVRDESDNPGLPTSARHRRAPSLPVSGPATTSPLFKSGIASLVWSLAGWFSYRYYVDHMDGDPKGRHAQALQGIAVLGAVAALLWPGNVLNKPLRKAFGRAVMRILSPSLFQSVTFADVLLADVLTSFAKVFGDVWLTACFLVPRSEHHTWWNGKGSVAVPIFISLPYAIRFRQCISEYFVTNAVSARPLTGSPTAPTATNKKPLWNAAKYASAFPVIWLSAWYDADRVVAESTNAKYNLWLLAVFVNSIFSFWWDVTNDWGLSVLQPASLSSFWQQDAPAGDGRLTHKRGVSSFSVLQHQAAQRRSEDHSETDAFLSPAGPSTHVRKPSLIAQVLRPSPDNQPTSLLFEPSTYQVAILLDLVLRFFWSLKLSSHLHHIVEWQGGVFLMEALEIARRWVWVFFRVEWEVVRRGRMHR